MCNWGNKFEGLVACCEPGSQSIYCQPSEYNKCSPTFEDSKGMFFTHCPGITKDLCQVKSDNLTLKNEPQIQTLEISNIIYRNMTDFAD